MWRLEVMAYDGLGLGLRALGFQRASGLGALLLRVIGPRTSKQKIILRNLEIAFPKLTESERRGRALLAWENMGRTFFEFPLMHQLARNLDDDVQVDGAEHLSRLAKGGEPCVIVTGHFANWEVMAAVLAKSDLDVAITYRRINNPYMDKRVRAQRMAYGTELLVPKSGPAGARHLIDRLRKGRSIALLNDQKFNTGLSLPFFGKEAMTAPGPTRLALKADAWIVPMRCRRDGAQFVVTIDEPWKAEDEQSGVERILRWTEEVIGDAPAQWFWAHRRWPKPEYRRD